MHVSEQQGEFINLDKIEEEDLEPGSDDELNQVDTDADDQEDNINIDTDDRDDNLDTDADD